MDMKEKFIVHVDMDAFFASCEERDNPSYRGKPVIVGADPAGGSGRGVVSACSYSARKFGVHSAMPISIAYRKCPHGVFLRVDMRKYSRISREIFEILESFTPDIEPISIDEAFLDITGSFHLFGTPVDTCRKIKAGILAETGLTSSVGLAPNKMTAKIASDIDKPDGLVVVAKESLLNFLHPLPVGRLWGVGEKTREAFKNFNIHTIGDLASYDIEKLCNVFGENGRHTWHLANGIDPREVETEDVTKSVSNEYTFGEDTSDIHKVKDTLMFLSEKVSRRLRKDSFKGRTVTLKIRFSDFKTYTRSITLSQATNFADIIYDEVINKLCGFDMDRKRVRLLGVRVSNLLGVASRDSLFDEETPASRKKENLYKALDRILDRFGEGMINRRNV